MKTIIKVIDREHIDKNIIHEAAEIIKGGGLVAFPTETVYGLGGNGLEESAAKKIYEAKGRPSDNPLILHIADWDSVKNLAVDIPETASILSKAFWPGPLTMIFKKSREVPYGTTGGLDTVAVRMPKDEIALSLIRTAGVPIAAPSANTSGRPSPTLAGHVAEDLDGNIDMILDGGAVGIGLESTIIDLTAEMPTILRPGYITKAMIEDLIGETAIDPAVAAKEPPVGLIAKAPGMKYKHYAPAGELFIVEGESHAVTNEINRRAKEKISEGLSVGIIATEEMQFDYRYGIVKSIGSKEDEETIARNLYKLLREFDQLKMDIIYTEAFGNNDFGQAIMNRLLKAAGYCTIYVNEG